jgi:hypothetical protein
VIVCVCFDLDLAIAIIDRPAKLGASIPAVGLVLNGAPVLISIVSKLTGSPESLYALRTAGHFLRGLERGFCSLPILFASIEVFRVHCLTLPSTSDPKKPRTMPGLLNLRGEKRVDQYPLPKR